MLGHTPSSGRSAPAMDADAVRAAYTPAALASLRSFPLDPDRLELVAMSENVTFRVVDRGDGASYVLRLHRPGYHTLEELDSERTWTRALDRAGVAVPIPVPAVDGRDYVAVEISATGERRFAGVTRWIEGRPLMEVMGESDDVEVLAGYFASLGRIAAAIHQQASGWRPPSGFRRHSLDRDGLLGETPFWGPFWAHPVLSPAERRLLLETRDRLRATLDRFGRDPTSYSMIHADLHAGNLLVHEGRLTVIDFDDAGFGWHPYEAAVALFRHRNDPRSDRLERALVEGYRGVRPLPERVRALIPMFLLIRGLALIGWIHGRPELGRTDHLLELKDEVCATCAGFEPPL